MLIAGMGESEPQNGLAFGRRVLIVAAIGLLFALLAGVLWYAADVLLLAFAGLLVAVFLDTLRGWVHQATGLPRGWALLLVTVVLVGVMAAAIRLAAPHLGSQFAQLMDELPRAFQHFERRLEQNPAGKWLLEHYLPDGAQAQSQLARRTTQLATTGFGAVASLLIVLFVGLYVAVEPDLYRRGLLQLVSPGRRPRVREVLDELGATLRAWLFAQILAMLVIALLTWLGLWWLGIPLAVTLAVLAGLLNFIPNFGPILSAVPAVLIALVQSPSKALYVVVLYLFIQLLESYVITPLVQRKAVELPPALIIVWQVLLGVLCGVLGLALATPLLAVMLVAVRMLYVEEVLGRASPSGLK